jgi:hypothetical protein
MKLTHIINKSVTETKDVLCNKCGESLRPPFDSNFPGDYYGLVEVGFSTGYLSKELPDGYWYTFSLCEKCLSELFKTFKHPPLKESEIFNATLND